MTLGRLVVTPPVAILNVSGTVQLSANAFALTGDALDPTALDSVEFELVDAADTVRVHVNETGLVTGRAPTTSAIRLNVFGFQEGVARADQVLLQVTASAITGATLSIQPIAPDSAWLALGATKTITPRIVNGAGQRITSPVMRYTVRLEDGKRVGVYHPTIRLASGLSVQLAPSPTVTANQIRALAGEGAAWVYGTASVYGTLLRDSVQYMMTYPLTKTIPTSKSGLAVTSTEKGRTITLAPDATVTFLNSVSSADPMTVSYTFNDPSAAGPAASPSTTGGASGDITALAGGQSSRRRFAAPGTYTWTAHASGPAPWGGQTLTGTIVIK